MPALNPPSMQIGVLPPGFTPFASAGPPLAYGSNLASPTLVQQTATASSAAAPSSFTANFAATQVGTTLVILVCYALSAAGVTMSPPANYVLTGSGNVATIGGRIYFLSGVNNPGGLTSFALTAITNVNGLVVWVSEWTNLVGVDTVFNGSGAFQVYSGSTTTPSVTSYTPASGPVLLIAQEADLTGQTYTPSNIGSGWVAGTSATSTNGATNVVQRPFFAITTPELATPYQMKGTLAAALGAGTNQISFLLNTSGALLQPVPQGTPGPQGWQGWGALGGTVPGGAGGGQ